MNKKILHNSIKKVFLDLKDVEHFVFWELSSNDLYLKSLDVAYNTTILSSAKLRLPSYVDSSFVIKEPESLLKMIDIIEGDMVVDISLKNGSNFFTIKDETYEGNFVITDINYIPDYILEKKMMQPEEPISYDVQIPVNTSFVEKYVKAKKANKSSLVSIWTKDRKTFFQLGENNSFTNKIKFSMEFDAMFDMEQLSFSADLLQIVLERNKNAEGKIYIDPDGLMKLNFNEMVEGQNIETTYFIVAQDNI